MITPAVKKIPPPNSALHSILNPYGVCCCRNHI
jgi:hypothetical protein